MKKHTNILINPFLLLGVFIIIANSCQKDDEAGIPTLTTTAVTDITQTTAKSGGNITSDGGETITTRGVCWSTAQSPTISDNKTTDGTGASSFASNISGLTANTTYYVRAYATNSKGTGYGSPLSFTTQQGGSGNSFTDSRDGNVYQTVTIGSQTWMAENLKYLPNVVGSATGSQTVPYYYVYGYNGVSVSNAKSSANYNTYGVLYNWTAAMAGSASSSANPSGVQGICPAGWHLPSDAEWTQLTSYLGGESVAGGKLKKTGTTHWDSPNTGATNETGFTALPGGDRTYDGFFMGMRAYGNWWSATEEFPNIAWYRDLSYYVSNIFRGNFNKEDGYSVRCIKN